jgi:hypothetical protein
MAEPSDQRSVRLRKPTVHFDDKIAQSLVFKNPTKPTKPTKPKPTTKSTENPLKPSAPPTIPATISLAAESIALDDVVEELCSQIEGLDIRNDPKAKKKAKAAEIVLRTRSGP